MVVSGSSQPPISRLVFFMGALALTQVAFFWKSLQSTQTADLSGLTAKVLSTSRVRLNSTRTTTNTNSTILDPNEGYIPMKNAKRHHFYPLRVPTPIFVLGLPKAGTSSIHHYFMCGHQRSSHTYGRQNQTQLRSGICMYYNSLRGEPLLNNCGDFAVWSDTGVAPHRNNFCYYPSIHGLNDIHRWYPNATLILNVRNATAWAPSIAAWSRGTLLRRWRHQCGTKYGFMRNDASEQDVADWYRQHNAHVRQFAREHPSHTYVEVNMEDASTGLTLERVVGIPEACWQLCRPGSKNACRPLDKDLD